MDKTFRILILGAGFSRLAGLPLGRELFRAVRRDVAQQYGWVNHVERDLSRFIEYVRTCDARALTPDDMDYEEFLGFLDVEHYLGLKGKDTWSREGNESQLMIRSSIGRVLLERTPATANELPSAYKRFAGGLTTTDYVLSFNYDTVMEMALDDAGVPYRLFPDRFAEIGHFANTIDDSRQEVVLLKLHGSIDWFDRSHYDRQVEESASYPFSHHARHPVFGPDRVVESQPLVDGLRPPGDPLSNVFRVADLRRLAGEPFWRCCPLLLAPSSSKLYYAQPLSEFWWGIQRAGGLNLSLGIVGYSLPAYDAYARQAIYYIARNFTEFEPNLSFGERKKSKLRIIDYRPDEGSVADLRARYRFLNWERTELRTDGFVDATVDWLLR